MNQLPNCITAYRVTLALLLLALLAGCGDEKASTPQAATPQARAIQQRRAHFNEMGEAMKLLDEQLKASGSDKSRAVRAAAKLVALGREIPSWFPAGSGPDDNTGVKTAAKPEIWSDAAGFARVQTAYLVEAEKLAKVVAEGSKADALTQYFATGVACANCHKPFRAKDAR